MQAIWNKIPYVIIGALLIIIIMMRSCGPSIPVPGTVTVTKTDTVWLKGEDSIVYKPGIVEILPGDTVYKDVDTLAILKDYFSKVVYNDTIKIDTFGYVLVKDTITQNRISNRTSVLNYKFPVVTNTITNTITLPPKRQLYVGFDIVGSSTQPINYFGPSVLLKTKQDQMYTGGVGVTSGGWGVKFGMLWKVKIK
jgi:hypothetical protein